LLPNRDWRANIRIWDADGRGAIENSGCRRRFCVPAGFLTGRHGNAEV
jgi:hypothetical protein